MFTPHKPHFCKIIVEDDRLRFPRMFIRKHGSELSSPLQLRVPDGLTFQIEMTKYDDEVWFENGWRQFFEHYSLKQGYFMLFEYEGNSSFQVLIFDMSATEIDYPYISNLDHRSDEECQEPNKDEEEANDEYQLPNKDEEEANDVCQLPNKDQEDTNDDFSAAILKMRKKYCPSMKKRKTTLDEEEPKGSDEEITSVELEDMLNQTTPVWETRQKYGRLHKKYRKTFRDMEEEEESVEISDLTPSESERKASDKEEEAKDNISAEILKETPPRKKYRRLYKKYRKTKSDKEEEEEESVEVLDLTPPESEWKTSDKEEEEEAEDNTSVETLKETPPRKKYHPNRKRRTTSNKNKNDSKEVSSSEGDLQMVVRRSLALITAERATPFRSVPPAPHQRASTFESDNPFFVVEMQPSYIDPGRKLVIPSNFTAKYLLNKADDVTLCTLDGKTWHARYFRYETNNKYARAVLYDGWRKFVRDNELELGDVCVFELIKRTKILMNVFIYRVREDSNCCSSSGGMNSSANSGNSCLSKQRSKKSKKLCSERPWLTAHEKARALLRAKDFKSENPYFTIVIQPAYVGIRWRVYIPYKFAKTYLDEKKGEVILQVSEGTSTWVVKFSVLTVGSGQQKAQFYSTWKGFARDNQLEVGDVCVFELIDREKSLFNVSIF